MRFPEQSLVNQRSGRYEPLHARCYCAAIAAAAATVVGAGATAYGAMKQGSATNAAAAASANNGPAIYGTKVEPVKYKSHVQLPAYTARLGPSDYLNSLPVLNQLSAQITRTNQRERDKISGGVASANLEQEGANINQMEHGNVPTAMADRVNRLVSERSGGAFSPAGGAGQMASEDFARSIGKTSYDVMTQGMTYAPQWESLVDAFTYKPQQAMGDALQMLRARTDYAKTQMEEDQNQYIAQLNYNRTVAGRDPVAAGQFQDQLALGTLQEKQSQNQMDALAGLLKSGIGLAGSFRSGGASADPYNSAGFINTSQLGTVASGYATPGYTPTFGTTPQGAYFTGYTS